MDLRPMTADEHATVRKLLLDSGLPVDDLDTADIAFTVAVNADGVIGAVGLETFDDVGLLRSLVITSAARGCGIGSELVRSLEAYAKAQGVKSLALLTQTAESFFENRGYIAVAREHAPPSVQRSAEFRSICPASATCMIKRLEATP